MIDKNLFLETLHEVAEIAATSSEKIKPEEVHRYFEGMELSEEQEKMVYEYLNLPPEAKAARQPECDKAAEEEEPEVETIEVYSDTDSASGIQIGADRGSKDTIEEEEEDAPQPKDVEQLSDSVYYKMYLNDVRERGEADEAKMLELYTAVLQGDQSVVNAIVDGWLMRVIHMAGMYEDVPVNMEDLIQEGNMALWMALGALPELGSAPEVDKYLEGRVIAGFEAHIREVTGDTDQVQAVLGKAALLHEARKYLAKENAQDPSIRELSEYTHISPEEIQDILAEMYRRICHTLHDVHLAARMPVTFVKESIRNHAG